MDFLVGVKEAGEILGWDRRKVSTYNLRGVLPKPVTNLSSGPIWLRKQIEYYKISKELSVPIYYIDGQAVYKCNYHHPKSKTNYKPEEIKKYADKYMIYKETDIKILVNIIVEENPIVEFLSFENISFLHDFGILSAEVFGLYIQLCAFKNIEQV
ncbi:hypothetical protein ABEQ41_24630 [Priestia megaterium]